MQDNSFDSFNLDEYVLDVEGFFNDYIIHKRKFKKDYAVFQGVMKDSPQAVKIYKRLFPTDLESRQRFHVLMNAFQQGIVLADNIFLSFENGKYYIYVVEPAFSSYQDKFIQLSHLLKLDLDYFKKHRLFQNLVIMLKSLHALGEPHMEICPKNIWVEDQFLVYLRPFKLKIENQNLFNWRKLEKLRDVNSSLKFNNNSKYWYMSPEQVICDTNRKPPTHTQNPTSHTQIDGFASDVWSLGCIFAEMFVSLTPVFQSVDSFDRTIRFFEVLGVPPREDVYYMTKELYARVIEELHSRTFNEDEFPLIQELVKNLSKNEEKVLSSLLMFNPNKRPRCENLIEFPFFKTFAPKKQKHEEENAKSSNNFIQIRSLLNGGDVPTGKSTREDEDYARGIYTHKNTKDMSNQGGVYSSRNNTENPKERQNSGNWWNLDLGGVPKGEQFSTNNALKPSNRMENQQSRTGIQAMPLNSSMKKGNSMSNVMKSAQKSNSKYQPLNERVQTDTYERSPSHPFKETLNTESGAGSAYKNRGQGSWTSRNFQNQNENNPTNYEYSPNMPPKQNVGMTPMSGKSSRKQYNSNQKRQSMPSVPKARLCVSIETLKNLSTRYPHGSYSCRIDIKPKTTDTEPINLFSNFADVQNRAAKLDFKGEADLELDAFVASFNKEPLKIYVFCRNTPFGVAKGGSEVFLYGVSEIDMSLLLMNGSFETGLDNERIKTISGWYHVYDPDDHYRTLGQMKIEIQFLLLSKSNGPRVPPSSSRDIRTRTNLDLTNSVSQKIRFEDSHNTRPSGRSLSSAQARTNIPPNQTVYEEKRHPLPRSMRKSSQINQPTQHTKNSSIFENIQTDLSKLNDNLKRREHEKAHSMSVRNYSQYKGSK